MNVAMDLLFTLSLITVSLNLSTQVNGLLADSFVELEEDVVKTDQLHDMSRLENRWASLWASHSTLSERILLRNLNSTIWAKRSSLTPSTTPAPVCLEKVCEEKICPVDACIPTNCTEVTRLIPAIPEKDCQAPVCAKPDCSGELECDRHRTLVCPPSFCIRSQQILMTDVNCSKITRTNVYDADRNPPKLCANIRVIHVTSGFPAVTQAPVTRTTRSVLFDAVLFAEESALSSSRCAEVPLLIGIGLLTIAFLVASAVIFGQRWSLNARHQEIIRLTRVIELNNLNGWIGEFDAKT